MSDAGELDGALEPQLPVLVDPQLYRVVVERLRRLDADAGRSRWLGILAAWDIMRIREADRSGLVRLHGVEWCETWRLDPQTWVGRTGDARPSWYGILHEANLVDEVPDGYQVDPLPRLRPDEQIRPGKGKPVVIDPVRYRIHAERLRDLSRSKGPGGGEAGNRSWWAALGAWGVLRMIECDPATRIVPHTRATMAEAWRIDPRSWDSWMELLAAADLLTVTPEGFDKLAQLRRRRRARPSS